MSQTAYLKTSDAGKEFLEAHEGVVLKAYRCPANILTIGAGLTRASGVINPKPGMTITKKEASRLLSLALERNYEPAVRKSMSGANQHEFDAGVNFHWNTGAIGRASWVKAWKARDWPDTKRRFMMWNKGGGRVLPGLVRRRTEEFNMMRYGVYKDANPHQLSKGLARMVVGVPDGGMASLRAAFKKVGYEPGLNTTGVAVDAVRAFQRDHELTADGIIGRATLSTLQRRLDVISKTATPITAVATGGATSAAPEQINTALPDGVAASDPALIGAAGTGVLVIGALALLWLAWRYRDVLAVKVQSRFPKIATKLRSF
ncbi:MAG: glycoside hydrolase family protein [Pseudomonadota bacterium]